MNVLLTFFKIGPIIAFALIALGFKLADWSVDFDGTRRGTAANVGGMISLGLGVPLIIASGFGFSVWGEPW